MTHQLAAAYLVAALAYAGFATLGVKYLLQITKGLLPLPSNPDTRTNATRLYAIAFGVVLLPIISFAVAYAGYGPALDRRELPFDAVVGGAAGLAAIMDYHFLTFLQTVASGGAVVLPLQSEVVTAPPAAPAVPPSTPPQTPPAH